MNWDDPRDFLGDKADAYAKLVRKMSDWKTGGEAYLPTLNAAEDRYGIPRDLLARVAFQECSWRKPVIDGTVKSSAGAVGMMQLMPRYFPGAGEAWQKDVEIAAEYLEQLHTRFRDWQLAVAAYNWGASHVQKYLDGQLPMLPSETSNYIAKVFDDVPIPGSIMDA